MANTIEVKMSHYVKRASYWDEKSITISMPKERFEKIMIQNDWKLCKDGTWRKTLNYEERLVSRIVG